MKSNRTFGCVDRNLRMRRVWTTVRTVIILALAFMAGAEVFTADKDSVVGTVISADPQTGIVVVDTDNGEVTVQVTPQTAHFKLVAAGKSLSFKVKSSENGLTATSVAFSRQEHKLGDQTDPRYSEAVFKPGQVAPRSESTTKAYGV